MKQTIGRFLLQPNKNFPIDCETMDCLQTNIAMLAVLGNLAGDKTILSGCDLEQNNTRRKAGYVFLKTKDFPDGEVLYWEGGNVSGGMYLNQETIDVTAQGYEFPQAYTVRSLVAGIGIENYVWGDFKTLKTPTELDEYNKTQDEAMAKIATPPLGIVNLWAGMVVPTGYELCEGQQLKIADYQTLYAVLGSIFNNATSCTGVKYSTSNGYFRLPDLRGRFVVGSNINDNDYNQLGLVGGEKEHILTIHEMPAHSHSLFLQNSGTRFTGSGRANELNSGNGNSGSSGANAAHENRPPYYTLAYIMRVK